VDFRNEFWSLILEMHECVQKKGIRDVEELRKELNMPHKDRVYKLLSLVQAWSKE